MKPVASILLSAVLFASILFASVPTAFAVITQTDDAVFGVDAIIRDLTNNRDWLRLDFTTPFTFNEVSAGLGPGGTFAGWSIASVANLGVLGASAGIVHASTDPAVLANAEELRDLFCFACVNTSSTHIYARGLVSDPSDAVTQLAFFIGRRLNVEPDEVAFGLSGFGFRTDRSEEIFLIRATLTAVPEPATLILIASGIGTLAVWRLRKRM